MAIPDSTASPRTSVPRWQAARLPHVADGRRPFILAGLAVTAVLSTHLVDFGADHLSVRLLNANSDRSWSHLLVTAVLVLATSVALVASRRRAQRGLWLAAAAALAFLCISETSGLHAEIDKMSWGKLVYIPVLLILAGCLWRLAGAGPARGVIRAGLTLLILSYAIHVLGPHVLQALGLRASNWAYQTKVGLKQGTELAGWLLVLLGVWTLTRRPAT